MMNIISISLPCKKRHESLLFSEQFVSVKTETYSKNILRVRYITAQL